jgi:predicted DNA-binding protein
MIWPFAARGARADTVLPQVDDLPAFEAFLVNDAVLKVWLPAKLSERVDWLSAHHGTSRPDVLRGSLFEHVYGRVAMRQLEVFARKRAEATSSGQVMASKRHRVDTLDDPKFSRARNINLEMLGKAADDFKLHLPTQLKTDLGKLANTHAITTSHYVRKALVLILMGERFHAEWQTALGRLGPMGADVAMMEKE